MGVHVGDNKIVIIIRPKTFYFHLNKDVYKSFKYKIDFTLKHYDFLTEHTINSQISNYSLNKSMETIFKNTENSKTN